MIIRSIIIKTFTLRSQSHIVRFQLNKLSRLKYDITDCKLYHVSSVYCAKKLENIQEGLKKLQQKKDFKEVKVWKNITVKEFAQQLNCSMGDLKLFLPNVLLTPDTKIDSMKIMQNLASKFNKKVILCKNPHASGEAKKKKSVFERQPPPKPENLVKRPPIVTVMGHVDHGKTTLLDSLRNTFVVEQEFGGITQHIGAFSVEVKEGRKIVFIDTPGHAAFTAMRSRGAQVTDLVVLVIAADDGIMEQTVESIKIANRAQVPIIVAVNKIDKPTARKIDDIKKSLLTEGIQVEDHGGNIQLVPISALKKINLDLLTEVILLEADLLDLKGDPTGLVEGFVIESKTSSKGILATVIIKRGTLKKGKIIVAGEAHARVRSMLDEHGNEYKEAPPSTPVQILGWKELPTSGDEVLEVPSEVISQKLRKIATMLIKERYQERQLKKQEEDLKIIEQRAVVHQEEHLEKKKELEKLKQTSTWKEVKQFRHELLLKNLTKELESDNTGPQLKLIIKGDVYGTLEVLMEILNTYEHQDECKVSIVDAGIGHVTIKDVELAELFDAIIYAFNVDVHETAAEVIKEKNIDIRFHNVLYKMIDELKEELSARIPPVPTEDIQGEAEVLQSFSISRGKKKVQVAGAKCTKGLLKRDSLYKIIRNNEIIFQGKLESLKHLKNEVKSIQKGVECGLMFESFNGQFEPGDQIVCYDMIDVPKQTSWDPGF